MLVCLGCPNTPQQTRWLKQQKSSCHSCEGLKSNIRPSQLSSGEGSLLGGQMTTFSLCPNVAFPWWMHVEVFSGLSEVTNPIRLGFHPSDFIYCLKTFEPSSQGEKLQIASGAGNRCQQKPKNRNILQGSPLSS